MRVPQRADLRGREGCQAARRETHMQRNTGLFSKAATWSGVRILSAPRAIPLRRPKAMLSEGVSVIRRVLALFSHQLVPPACVFH